MIPQFELRRYTGRRVGIIAADNLESVFVIHGRLKVVTIDAKEYTCDSLEYMMTKPFDKQPEYSI
jgi:hypothetical protein